MQNELKYHKLSRELQEKIRRDRAEHWENPFRFQEANAVRPGEERDRSPLWRPAFVRDTEKILHLPMYNRYADKTQVLSFYENDDITRRGLHVQLVSRIARNIGSMLGLNLDLIEAISLGHDLGHTPFGHAGERYLSELMQEFCGRYFFHNVQSVRVLDAMFQRKLTLQTLDGILCHNGEFEQQEYRPRPLSGFDELNARAEACLAEGDKAVERLVPSTLEACVVRICDMIAYLGKDRQDALTAHIIEGYSGFTSREIGDKNAAIINNMSVDLIENSYGKDHLLLSPATYRDLKAAKKENYERIYHSEAVSGEYEHTVRPMLRQVFERLLRDIREGNKASPVFRHHIDFIRKTTRFYRDQGQPDYLEERPEQIAADYIASMTDSYFLSLHAFLFPQSKLKITYHSYFEDLQEPPKGI
ncbi:deoxyguanosinetriphosphate triphosphohydrolase family protein [Neglectibacter caecimuris]|uniref:deoxyguanosinetriphosphate triphosphohydrolase family protein n=1 Tax=Neglectibacter caecimuris TaxID=3093658 RepID=UPI002AC9B9F8|nr:HD domain-containing protein [Neglectibacter sp. M00184]